MDDQVFSFMVADMRGGRGKNNRGKFADVLYGRPQSKFASTFNKQNSLYKSFAAAVESYGHLKRPKVHSG